MKWGKEPHHDDVALTFYHSLSTDETPHEEIWWALACAYVAHGFYTQAEAFLSSDEVDII
jgi:hypothetical protein